MKVLVDTHTWLWMLTAPQRIPDTARTIVGDPLVDVLLSTASIWEIAIKCHLGKLPLPDDPDAYVPSRLAASGTVAVAIEPPHALRAGSLPDHHRDPFDRLIIAQAQLLDIPVVTGDPLFDAYDVATTWT